MNKEIHWLLMSLNQHLHYLDNADKAYINIQQMNEEIQMWRRRHAKDQKYSEKETELLCSLETNCFYKRTPSQVYKDFIKQLDV